VRSTRLGRHVRQRCEPPRVCRRAHPPRMSAAGVDIASSTHPTTSTRARRHTTVRSQSSSPGTISTPVRYWYCRPGQPRPRRTRRRPRPLAGSRQLLLPRRDIQRPSGRNVLRRPHQPVVGEDACREERADLRKTRELFSDALRRKNTGTRTSNAAGDQRG
jgi:hypothetical protein